MDPFSCSLIEVIVGYSIVYVPEIENGDVLELDGERAAI
jgi:hypothetical protein